MIRGSRAVILVAAASYDVQTKWSTTVARALSRRLEWIGLLASIPTVTVTNRDDVLRDAAATPLVVFLGHASAEGEEAGLSLGSVTLGVDALTSQDWTGCVVILIGCETAVDGASELNVGKVFFDRGARAVVGTSARVTVGVADYFFEQFLELLINGLPLDYAFFLARRRTCAFEALVYAMSTQAAEERIASAVANGAERGLSQFLDGLGLEWGAFGDAPRTR